MKYHYSILRSEDMKSANALLLEHLPIYIEAGLTNEGIHFYKRIVSVGNLILSEKSGIIRFFGCFKGPILVGFIAVKKNNLIFLITDKNNFNNGIAAKLLKIVLNDVTERNTLSKKIITYALKGMTEKYKKLGFMQSGSGLAGYGIVFIPMEYQIKEKGKKILSEEKADLNDKSSFKGNDFVLRQ